MKALVCHQITDDFSGLEVRDIAVPEPGEGEVRVRVKAAGVNFPDLLMSQGKYQFKPEPPFSPGGEVAGAPRDAAPRRARGAAQRGIL